MNSNRPILFFDGVCNLCNASVNFVLKKDKKKQFLFASLQSDVARKILLHKNQKINMDSIVLLKDDVVYTKSDAALLILQELGFPYNLMSVFKVIPRKIRDKVYDVIAKNRYKWFGKKETCMVPKDAILERFLN